MAALSARPAATQEGFAAVAVSPSTLDSGESSGTTSLTNVGFGAVQACQTVGARDCKVVYSVANQCVALAIKKNPNTYAYGVGATREAAAANAIAACTKEGTGGVECWIEESPCANDNPNWLSPLPLPPGGSPGAVDPALVGFWKLNVSNGIWVWQITANGTYTFHSEAPDKAPSHNGWFATNNGHYSLTALSTNWVDQGTYTMQGSMAVVMTGKLGTGTWVRIAADPGYSGRPLAPASGPASAPITIRR
ncbi:MAG: DUF4189 domain-containing protein [Terracidiphilus sp.]